MRRRRKQFFHKPFKGNSAYEWQIGPFVLMWFHTKQYGRQARRRYYNEYLNAYLWEFSAGRFLVWNDPLWQR